MTEIRDEGNLPCYQQGLYSSSEKQPPAKLNPAHRGSSALLRAYYISQTRSCLAYASALPSVTKGKKPVGSKNEVTSHIQITGSVLPTSLAN